jgi:hypothetical protein
METFVFVNGRQVASYGDAKQANVGSLIYLDDNTELKVLNVKIDHEQNQQSVYAGRVSDDLDNDTVIASMRY